MLLFPTDSVGDTFMSVCVCAFVPGAMDDMCARQHLECPECEGWRRETKVFVGTPLMAGHASVIGWSPEVGEPSGSCHSSEERSKVNFTGALLSSPAQQGSSSITF